MKQYTNRLKNFARKLNNVFKTAFKFVYKPVADPA